MPITAKKVLFTSHTANFAKFNRPFMRWLASRGYEVHYASAGEEQVLDCDEHFTIPFARSPLSLNNLRAIFELKKIIDAQHYDIIHTHTPMGSIVTRIAAMAARKRGTRVIYTAHGFHFFTGAPIMNWLIYYPIEKIMARFTDTLVAINKEDYERATKSFKTDVRYVPGVGIDPKKFDIAMTKTDKKKLRESLGLKESDFVIVYVAELSKRKNQLWLIDTLAGFIKNHSDVHLLLPGQDSLAGKCQQLVVKLGIDHQVHFLGYRSDIPQLMKSSDLAVSASKQEGLPVNVMEAMYLGMPVIVTDCRGNHDLVEDKKSGYIIKLIDEKPFTRAVEALYKKPELRKMLGFAAKEYIEKYSLDVILREMHLVYEPKGKIIHLLASNKFSGAENVACTIIEGTDPNMFDSIYCSPDGDIRNNLLERGIKFTSIDKLNRKNLKAIICSENPTHIHAHDFRAGILASFFVKNVKVVSHIHQNPYWLSRLDVRSIFYMSRVNKFSKIIVVSDAIRNNATFVKIAKKMPVQVLHNRISKQRVTVLASRGVSPSYDIGFFGRLVDFKQPLHFVEIVGKIKETQPNVKAVIVGDGPLMKDVVLAINHTGLSNNIDVVGYTDNPYVYMKNSKFSVMCSNQDEGFGLVNVEATILDTVVLAHKIPSLSEIFKDSVTLLVSMDDIVKTYHNLRSSPKKYNQALSYNKKALSVFIRESQDTDEFVGLYTGKGVAS